MNNVWASIALRAPCAACRTQRKPLLQLFNGYSRSRSTINRNTRITSISDLAALSKPNTRILRSPTVTRAFSVAAPLRRQNNRQNTNPVESQPNLKPAQTAASHTEGVVSNAEEQLTWRDYDPNGGMPLPQGDLPQSQLQNVFDSDAVDVDTGNYILSVLHWRRMSGALIDAGIDFPNDSGVSREQAIKGLEYLRSVAPDFDEEAAGNTWVEEESHRLREELQQRAVKLGLYKRIESEDIEEEEEQQGTDYGRERNRESQLQLMRQENIARAERENAERETAEKKAELTALNTHRGPLELSGGVQPSIELVTYTGPGGITVSRPKTKAWLQPVKKTPWTKYYEDQAQIIKDNTIPQMSVLQRLGPSFIFLVAVLGLAVFLSDNYYPPPNSARVFPNTRPEISTLGVLTAVLGSCFILSRFPPMWRTVSKYFTLVPAYPYAFSIVGSAYRHDTLAHLATNVASLWFFGLLLHEDVDRGTFMSIFTASGAVGAFTTLTHNVLRQNWMTYVFGSSGCVLGVVAAACTLRPNGTLKVFGQEIPVAAWLFLPIWGLGTVLIYRFTTLGVGIDHAGHIGGLVTGFAAAAWLKWKQKAERQGERTQPIMTEQTKEQNSNGVDVKDSDKSNV